MAEAPVPGPSTPTADAAPPSINVQKLADKVYQLLLADARIGRARGDSPLVHERRGEG
jgi:hypothetical protein